jgi:hypothetical protein
LNLEVNQIGNRGTQYLANALQKNHVKSAHSLSKYNLPFISIQMLTTLILVCNNIGFEGAQYLGIALQENKVTSIFT